MKGTYFEYLRIRNAIIIIQTRKPFTLFVIVAAVARNIMNGKEISGIIIGGTPLITANAAPFLQWLISSKNALETSSTLKLCQFNYFALL